MNKIDSKSVVMTIAGSDSGAGAGIQADLKTITSLGSYGTTVITALTAQNTQKVYSVLPVSTSFIEEQFNAIISDFDVKAIKTGMLPSCEAVECVAKLIKNSNIKHIIVDPVIVATSGDNLTLSDTSDAFKEILFPLATIVTPNWLEVKQLVDISIESLYDAFLAGTAFLEFGSKYVLIKGGHWDSKTDEGEDEIVDILVSESEQTIDHKPKIETKNLHGTGCTLSAALATYLAQGETIEEAFFKAENYIKQVIFASKDLQLTKGNGPLWQGAPLT